MFGSGLWWIFPLMMIILCFFMMTGRMRGMCGPGGYDSDVHSKKNPESALDILDKKYAQGEIGKDEYEERTRVLTQRS